MRLYFGTSVQSGDTGNGPYDSLKAAVVKQAVYDYVNALRALRKCPDNKRALKEARSLEGFFRSEDYTLYGNVNGNTLIRMCRELADSGKDLPKANNKNKDFANNEVA